MTQQERDEAVTEMKNIQFSYEQDFRFHAEHRLQKMRNIAPIYARRARCVERALTALKQIEVEE